MTELRKQQIHTLLKGIETGDAASVAVINPEKYIQHNPQTHEGREGLAALFKRLSSTSPRVNITRLFSDGDFVFGHTEYDFSSSRVGFEIFRFEGEFAVEHWDNIQPRKGPNLSGHSMVDGQTTAANIKETETNREHVRRFIESVLIGAQNSDLSDFVADSFTEHNPDMADGLPSLKAALIALNGGSKPAIQYKTLHRILAEGNFVLSVCEGYLNSSHTSFYDLFRIQEGKIIEHWDTKETIPPRNEWKNDNGKF